MHLLVFLLLLAPRIGAAILMGGCEKIGDEQVSGHPRQCQEILKGITGAAQVIPAPRFFDNFAGYQTDLCYWQGSVFGHWTNVFAGGGCVKVVADGERRWLQLESGVAALPDSTFSSLASGPAFSVPFNFRVRAKTLAQLRQGSAPNSWEVAWVLWNYADNEHFYYFIAKPNGWELGKEDPAYPGAQRFLATGSLPAFPIGQECDIEIDHDTADTIRVKVNGAAIVVFTDTERPYRSGKIALYHEDARVQFTEVSVIPGVPSAQ